MRDACRTLRPFVSRKQDGYHSNTQVYVRKIAQPPRARRTYGVDTQPEGCQEVKRIIADQKLPETAVLVSVAGGGCSGFEYRMSFDDTPNEAEDIITESHGIRVAVDRRATISSTARRLTSTRDSTSGVCLQQPLGRPTCGCGSSFQV